MPPLVAAHRRFLARRGGRRWLSQASRPALEISPQTAGAPVWTAAGPLGVNSLNYGLVTGRIAAIALDPSDATGNHVFLGTTGGGVWRSQNAAAINTGSIVFTPLTDSP